ncbi:hypothetical protein [Oceanicaulis sp.]|uniref:hypothetical protein n=1 Tax=Oceanicaulis sp. TaxID=1924941 RepID=UPI003BABFA7F
MRKLIIAASSLSLMACASDRVDYGGTLHPVPMTNTAKACDSSARERVAYRAPDYPDALLSFLWLVHDDLDSRSLLFQYDIAADGRPVNIRYVGEERYINHDSYRTAVRAGAEAIADWRYRPEQTATHDCTISMMFVRPGRGMSQDEALDASR